MLKVSIITPCYNSEKYVGRTIESVRAQTLSDWEHIIVDDGSTDSSAAVVERYLPQDRRLRLVRRVNSGCAQARNAGFRACSPDSQYLLFLDADDCLEPEMLEVVNRYLEVHPQVGMTHCSHQFIDAEDHVITEQDAGMTWSARRVPHGLGIRSLRADEPQTPFEAVFALAGIIPSLAVFRRSIYESTPGWDEEMGIIYEDVSLYLHMALRSEVHYIPQKLVCYRIHPRQTSAVSEKFSAHERKLYAKWQRPDGLTREQQEQVEKAWAFREGRLIPFAGFAAARRHLARGEFREAIRFGGGAVRRYAASFLPSFCQVSG